MLRNRILLALLWISTISLSTWVGGTLYQMVVVVPLWSGSPPESVREFFTSTDYNRTIFNFFGPPFMMIRTLPLFAALLAGWHSKPHRTPLLVASACFTFALVFTIAYVYPINETLFEQAGGNRSAEEIRSMAQQWILADRIRFVVGICGFLATLHAFRLPLPAPPAANS